MFPAENVIEYKHNCPYYRKAREGPQIAARMFRLLEIFPDSTIYTGDSFGDHRYIDIEEPRPCSLRCRCMIQDTQPEEKIFSFRVFKDRETMHLRVYSSLLKYELTQMLLQFGSYQPYDETIFDGFVLLTHRQALAERLEYLRKQARLEHATLDNHRLVAEMSLLVNGLLGDPEVFQSYGFEYLSEKGHLTLETWKAFQTAKVNHDLDLLENAFYEVDDDQQTALDIALQDSLKSVVDHGCPKRGFGCECCINWTETTYTHIVPKGRCGPKESKPTEPAPGEPTPSDDMIINDYMFINDDKIIDDRMIFCGYIEMFDGILQDSHPPGPTPLMIEIRSNNKQGAMKLIQDGADINELTQLGTALSVAAQCASKPIIQMLLWRGADVHSAFIFLQSQNSYCAIDELEQNIGHFKRKLSREGRRVPQRLQQLHKEFRNEHEGIIAAVGSQPSEKLWTYNIDKNHRKAWERGIGTIRSICNGILPRNHNEVIMCLAVSRAMARTMDRQRTYGLEEQFFRDLGRWQVVFDHSDGSLHAFQQAVHDIWGLRLYQIPPLPSPDLDVLFDFQTLVLNLMGMADKVFHFDEYHQDGLLYSQNQKRARTEQLHRMFEPTTSTTYSPQSENGTVSADANTDFLLSIENSPMERSESSVLRSSMHFDCEFAQNFKTAVLLMAGAIFALIMLFLLSLQSAYISSESAFSSRSILQTLGHHTTIAGNAIDHVISVALSDCIRDRDMPMELQTKIKTFIEGGLVKNVWDLNVFFGNEAVFQSPDIRNRLLAVWRVWYPSYLLEEAYHNLELYMGLSDHYSIIPRRQYPRTWKEELQITLDNEEHSTSISSPASSSTAFVGIQESETFMIDGSPSQSPQVNSHPLSMPTSRKTFCDDCGRDFGKVCNYNKHRKDKHEKVRFPCRYCRKTFSRNNYRDIHERKRHSPSPIPVSLNGMMRPDR